MWDIILIGKIQENLDGVQYKKDGSLNKNSTYKIM